MRFIHSISITEDLEEAKSVIESSGWSGYWRNPSGVIVLVTRAAPPWSGVTLLPLDPKDYVIVKSSGPAIMGM